MDWVWVRCGKRGTRIQFVEQSRCPASTDGVAIAGEDLQFVSSHRLEIGQVDQFKGGSQPRGNGGEWLREDLVNGVGELFSIVLAQFDRSSGEWILVPSTGIDEHRRRSRILLLK